MVRKLDSAKATQRMLDAKIKPLVPYINSRTNWKSLCLKCKKIISPRLSDVTQGMGCGHCAGVIPDLKKIMLVMKKAGLKPLEPYKNALSKWKCLHILCGNIVYPTYNMVQNGQGGCRPCSFVKTGLSHRITEKEAKNRLKKHKLQLAGKYKWQNKNKNFKIECLICKKISMTNWDTLGKKGRQLGCRTCSRKAASFLQVTEEKHKQLLAEHNLEVVGKYTGAYDRNKVKCLICGKKSEIRRIALQARTKKMQGCMKCSGAPVADPNKIAKVMKKAKLNPLVPYPGSHKRWKCECLKCGEIVYPAFGSVLNGQGGCIYCASGKINPKQPAFLYLMTHEHLDCVKVGIGSSSSRITIHRRKGWELVKKWDFNKGEKAIKLESETLNHIRKSLGLKHYLSKDEMPQGGHTETFSLDQVSALYIKKYIDKIT